MKRALNQKSTSPSVDLRALAEYVEQFSTKTIVLLGDFVADVFEFGDISRVSREAPVLILRHRETQLLPGGGANAANNFADLGAKILPVTAVGDDANGNALIRILSRQKRRRFPHRSCEGLVHAREDAIPRRLGPHRRPAGPARGPRAANALARFRHAQDCASLCWPPENAQTRWRSPTTASASPRPAMVFEASSALTKPRP